MKIAVLMSGGVDSSVAAALLKDDGHDIFGITMKNFDNRKYDFEPGKAIEQSIRDAEEVCRLLNIEHFTVNLEKIFEDIVVKNFIENYQSGLTPNPCCLCNPAIKWGKLLDKSLELGADKIATGHYVFLRHNEISNRATLSRNSDTDKDQSYMLWGLKQQQLKKTLFPNQDYTKKDVRKLANKFKLHIHKKKDSQEICFVKNHYAAFLKKRSFLIPGDIVFKDGKVIGKHKGLALYTIGQRKGLNTPWKSPLYVLGKDKNVLTVTDDLKDLRRTEFLIRSVNWISEVAPSNIDGISVQIRYNSNPVRVKELVKVGNKNLRVILKDDVSSVAPGQSAVFYEGDVLLGGGIIVE